MKSFEIILGLGLLTSCLAVPTPGGAAVYTNHIQSFAFDPPTRTITAGDMVVWVNLDAVGHTVTGDSEDEPFCGGGFILLGGQCARTFNTAGTFTYHCEPHESMVGTVVVGPAGNNSPLVFISAPADGATFVGPTNVLIRAAAVDSDGAVVKVTFHDGPVQLGVDTTAPFETVQTLGPGRHVLTAVAFDDGGAQTASFPVAVTVTGAVHPPLRILDLSVGNTLVLTSAPTNYANVQPEYKTSLSSASSVAWLPLTVLSNRATDGVLESFCGRPDGSAILIRLRSQGK